MLQATYTHTKARTQLVIVAVAGALYIIYLKKIA